MRILTVRQPWAWALIHAGKDVENRSRNIAGAYRGLVAIHAGLTDDDTLDDVEHPMHGFVYRTCPNAADPDHNRWWCQWCSEFELERWRNQGHIVGVAELVDVHPAKAVEFPSMTSVDVFREISCCTSPWGLAEGWHLVFKNSRRLTRPLRFPGGLGLRRLSDHIATAVEERAA